MTCVNRQVPAIYYRNSAMQRYTTIKYSIINRNISVILTCAVYKMKLATFYYYSTVHSMNYGKKCVSSCPVLIDIGLPKENKIGTGLFKSHISITE